MVYLIMRVSLAVVFLCAGLGCNLRQTAMRSLADTVAEPGGVYGRDDDPELVRDALPVMLKIMEQLADGLPDHQGVRLALARSFTSYGVAFVQEEADRVAEQSVEKARPLYARARRLFGRAAGYGFDGLDLAVPGFKAAFSGHAREAQERVLAQAKKEHVPLLYWTAAALGSQISVSKDDMQLVGEVPKVERMMRRALALDESFDEGALHEFFVTFEGSRRPKEAERHYRRARELSKNKKVGPLVSYAEAVLVDAQDKAGFQRLLEEALKLDVDSDPDHRLVNIIAQRRARWLLSRTSDLFAE